jgi:2-oxoacid dehydrogenases acyltransferase (catalytic domain)
VRSSRALANPDRDQVLPLTPFERLSGEIIDALKTPLVQGLLELDLSGISSLGDRGISQVAFMVAAVGRVLAADPVLHSIVGPRTRIIPAGPEIGVSVTGRGALAPVTIIREPHKKDALTIQKEILRGAKAARRQEVQDMRRTEILRFVPSFLRRLFIRWALSPRVRRKLVGTFQISSLETYQIEAAMTPVAAAPLLMLGRCRERPVVREGKVVVRPIVWAVLHGDHRVMNGATASAFRERLQAILDQPEALLPEASAERAEDAQGLDVAIEE